jgi:hypothetical protein
LEFTEGESVFLKLTPRRNLGDHKLKKLQPRYVGPFAIVHRIGKVAYRLALPPELRGIHDVFHVSQLRQYLADPDQTVNDVEIELTTDLSYEERPVRILEFGSKELRQRKIPMVKVLWSHHPTRDATWETESNMRQTYPELFEGIS